MLGAVLFYVAGLFDEMDGMLARLKFAESPRGTWLEGFADHVNLSPLTFVAAGALALGIALATVAGHALIIARAKPVDALRYE